MNCFNHTEQPALGICKHCHKGICNECLHDSGDGIACKGKCTDEVKMINRVIQHNKIAINQAQSNWTSSGLLYIILGALFLVAPFLYFRRVDPFPIIMGSLFLAYGIYVFLKGRMYKEKTETDF